MSSKLSTRLAGLTIGLTACSLVPVMGYAQDALQEEIVVTARKREESLLEVPVAVSTLNQEQIIERSILDTQALSAFTPGFTLQNQGQGGNATRQNPNIRFRGLAVQQDNPAARAGAIFWDGAYISDGVGILQLIDLERAEVIKGPQTAFFGRNTFSGAVNFIPRRPGDEMSGRVIASYAPDSDGDSYEITGAIGGPITDTLGFRVALSQNKIGADRTFDDGTPLAEQENTSFWGMLTFEPTDALSMRLSSYLVESQDTNQLYSQIGPFQPGNCNKSYSGNLRRVGDGTNLGSFTTDLSQSTLQLFCGSLPSWKDGEFLITSTGVPDDSTPRSPISPAYSASKIKPEELSGRSTVDAPNFLGANYDVWRAHFAADYEFSNGYILAGFISHGEASSWTSLDGDFGKTLPRWGGFLNFTEDTSYELRLNSPQEGRLRWSLGVNYYDQETDSVNFIAFQFGPTYAPDVTLQEGSNLGIFGSIDFDITDQLTASFEGRWTDDEQTILFEGNGGNTRVENETASYEEFAPRFVLSWQPTDNINVYGSYARSFLQGIASNAAAYGEALPDSGINPETVGFFTPTQELDAFEVGWKQSVGNLDYSVAIYFMDWQNQTFFDLSPPPQFVAVSLPGDAEYTGIEVEWTWALTDWFRFIGGFNWVDAEFTNFGAGGSVASAVLAPGLITGGTQIDTAGNAPRYIPDTTGVFSFDFNWPIGGIGLYARADTIWTGDFYIDNFEYNEVPGNWRINLRGGAELTENLRAEIYGLNISDNQSWITAGGTTTGTPGTRSTFGQAPQQREVGVRLIATF